MATKNAQRARHIARVLLEYDTDDTDFGCLIDLLANVRHWCDVHGQCYGDIDRRAYRRYLAEIEHEQGGQP